MKRRGFTLIELLVCVAILALICGIFIPMLVNSPPKPPPRYSIMTHEGQMSRSVEVTDLRFGSTWAEGKMKDGRKIWIFGQFEVQELDLPKIEGEK